MLIAGFALRPPSHWGSIPSHWEGATFSWCLGDVPQVISQTGQAELVAFICKNGFKEHDLVFLDIGANDDVSHSSTCLLDALGWKGMLVEPNPELVENLRKNRPNCITVNAACLDQSGIVDLLTHTVLSTLGTMPSLADPMATKRLLQEAKGTGLECVTHAVACVPAVSCYRHVLSKYGKPSFVKIDAEGCEGPILRSILHGIEPEEYPLLVEIENNNRNNECFNYLRGV